MDLKSSNDDVLTDPDLVQWLQIHVYSKEKNEDDQSEPDFSWVQSEVMLELCKTI